MEKQDEAKPPELDREEAWVALNMLPHIGPVLFQRLSDAFGGPEGVLRTPLDSIRRLPKLSAGAVRDLAAWRDRIDPKAEIRAVRRAGSVLITLDDPEYPPRLREAYAPPPVLYCLGRPAARDDPAVAIVGTRRSTARGITIAERLARRLAEAGITVVSGLARGIDTAAHRGALAGGGRTVAVLGSGLDRIYPPENRTLAKSIAERGVVCSEFPLGTQPHKGNFPVRNRVIAAWAWGTIVVEASDRSGALITAYQALEEGREVFAVPGPVTEATSRGCHRLLREGASLLEDAEEILGRMEDAGVFTRRRVVCKRAERNLSEAEAHLLSLLSHEPRHVDGLLESSGKNAADIAALLTRLEIRGIIRSLPGHHFVLNAEDAG